MGTHRSVEKSRGRGEESPGKQRAGNCPCQTASKTGASKERISASSGKQGRVREGSAGFRRAKAGNEVRQRRKGAILRDSKGMNHLPEDWGGKEQR